MSDRNLCTPDTYDVRNVYVDYYMRNSGALHSEVEAEFDRWLAAHDAKVKRDAAREALDGLEADTAQVIRTMRERGEQGWARYAIANDILDNHRTRFYPEETP